MMYSWQGSLFFRYWKKNQFLDVSDPKELKNLINTPAYQAEVKELRQELLTSQRTTDDPRLCSPGGKVGSKCISMEDDAWMLRKTLQYSFVCFQSRPAY